MHEPDGYPEANDVVIAAAAASGGTLLSLLPDRAEDPAPVAEARRCLDAGARGIKLHPRAERFTLLGAGRARARRASPTSGACRC